MRQFEEPQHLAVFTDSDRTRNAKQLTDDLKNIDKATQNMKANSAKYDRLVEEKVNVKPEVTAFSMQLRPMLADDASNLKNLENLMIHLTPHGSETTSLKNDIIEQNIIEMDEFNDENEDETSLKCNMQAFNERKLNVKDFNVEEGVLRKEARYLVQKQH